MDRLLTLAEVKAVVESITYKPGWKIEATYDKWSDSVMFEVRWMTDDSYHPERRIQVAMAERYPINIFRSPATVIDIVRGLIHRAEKHESDEWLRVDGVLFHDPHAKDMPPFARI